jgi:hypothetical protein
MLADIDFEIEAAFESSGVDDGPVEVARVGELAGQLLQRNAADDISTLGILRAILGLWSTARAAFCGRPWLPPGIDGELPV